MATTALAWSPKRNAQALSSLAGDGFHVVQTMDEGKHEELEIFFKNFDDTSCQTSYAFPSHHNCGLLLLWPHDATTPEKLMQTHRKTGPATTRTWQTLLKVDCWHARR